MWGYILLELDSMAMWPLRYSGFVRRFVSPLRGFGLFVIPVPGCTENVYSTGITLRYLCDGDPRQNLTMRWTTEIQDAEEFGYLVLGDADGVIVVTGARITALVTISHV